MFVPTHIKQEDKGDKEDIGKCLSPPTLSKKITQPSPFHVTRRWAMPPSSILYVSCWFQRLERFYKIGADVSGTADFI